MDKQALKEVIFGGVQEMCRNKKLYYKGIGPDYSYWTEEGEKALQSYMSVLAYQIVVAEEEDLKERSKQMVINDLKGDKV